MAQNEGGGLNSEWSGLMGDPHTVKEFRHYHWEGSFVDYLNTVKKDSRITRNAFQRVYDMILSWGTSSYVEYKKNIIRYKFFDDPIEHGKDAVFGLDVP